MGEFGCSCGHVIGFNTTPLRYDADVIRNSGSDELFDALPNEIADFIGAVRDGTREQWITRFYEASFGIENASVVSDIITKHLVGFTLCCHQCERCGRIWLERPRGENAYASYLPEGDWRGALETPVAGFLRYVDGQDFFGGSIAEVRREGDAAVVIVRMKDGTERAATFEGVTAVTRHEQSENRVRFLSEWEADPPLHRFVFDSASQHDGVLLKITATGVVLGS